MKNIILHSKNLNNSLVFYRALFARMPNELKPSCIQFETNQLQLKIIESEAAQMNSQHVLEIWDHKELEQVSHRMSRFKSMERMKEDCEEVGLAIGLIDPDGHKWVIGDPEAEVRFEKCYLNTVTI